VRTYDSRWFQTPAAAAILDADAQSLRSSREQMLSLTALAGWEAAVLGSIRGASGDIDERDAQITRSGIYAEYPAIFAGYLELVLDADDVVIASEALKRAVFIAWYGFQALPTVSAIAELPESAIRRLMNALDDTIAVGDDDEELRVMLAWYVGEFGYVFEHFGPVRGLDAFIGGVAPADVRALAGDGARWAGRGQMGEYWAALGSSLR
jgi:hypothetical protein